MKTLGTIQADANAEVYAVATGALPDGKPVIVNSNGTVSVAGAVAAASGSVVNFTSNNAEETDIAYIGSSKIVIAYKDDSSSNKGTAVVGTISGTSLSFGTPVVFNNADTRNHVKLDSIGSDKVVIVFQDVGDSNHGTAIVGTVSGTSISFGSEADFETNNDTIWPNVASIGDNKVVIAWCKDAGSSANGIAVVGTVSGTSISFGTEVVFDAVGKYNAVASIGDSKVVIAYRDDADGDKGKAIVGTVSGTNISFGTTVVYNDAGTMNVDVGSIGSSKVVIAYSDTGNSYYGTAIVGTVSGTSISYGSEVVFESVSIAQPTVSSIGNDRVQITYIDSATEGGQATTITGTVSGTAIAFSDLTTFGNNKNHVAAAAVGDNQIVVAYKQAGNSDALFRQVASTNFTTENFLGFTGGIKNTVTETQAVGSEVTFHAVAAYPSRATFDSSNNKIVIAYEDNDDSSHGKAVVGTIDPSDNSVSYGSPVDFESAATNHAFITFDSNSNKVVIAYQDADNSTYGTAIVGTVSGTSISFGSPVVFAAVANTGVGGITFDSASNKVVIIYEDTGNSERGTAIVGTVSGTSISFGSEATFTSSKISPAYATVSFDSTSNRVVVGYRDYTNSGHGYAAVGTVSGTSISFGTPVAFNAASTLHVSSAYDSNADKTLITYRDDGNSSYGTAIVGTVSGTSISFGSGTVFNSANSGYQSASFNSSTKNITVSYTDVGNSNVGKVVTATISGSSVSFGSTITFANETVITYGNAYDSANNRTILTYRDTGGDDHGQSIVFKSGGDVVTFGSTPDGKTATVQAGGAINTLQSSLTAGQQYFVQADGTIGTTAASPSVIAGTAVSATDLIVKG